MARASSRQEVIKVISSGEWTDPMKRLWFALRLRLKLKPNPERWLLAIGSCIDPSIPNPLLFKETQEMPTIKKILPPSLTNLSLEEAKLLASLIMTERYRLLHQNPTLTIKEAHHKVATAVGQLRQPTVSGEDLMTAVAKVTRSMPNKKGKHKRTVANGASVSIQVENITDREDDPFVPPLYPRLVKEVKRMVINNTYRLTFRTIEETQQAYEYLSRGYLRTAGWENWKLSIDPDNHALYVRRLE